MSSCEIVLIPNYVAERLQSSILIGLTQKTNKIAKSSTLHLCIVFGGALGVHTETYHNDNFEKFLAAVICLRRSK